MALSEVVRVQISRETAMPTQIGFGIPLVMGYHTVFPELCRLYENVDDMVTDGFTLTDPVVRKVAAMFSQSPRPEKVLVGRETVAIKMKYFITPTTPLKASYIYKIKINGLLASFTSDASPTSAEICNGLKAAIDALGESVVTVVTGNGASVLAIESATAGESFRLEIVERKILTRVNESGGTPADLVTDIVNLRDVNDDWYTLAICNQSKGRVKAAAAYVETLVRNFVYASADDNILDPAEDEDLFSEMQALGYVRSMGAYHHLADCEEMESGWIGRCIPYAPGSITWDLKTLAGVSYTDLTTTEKNTIKAKDGNYYTRISGINITQIGITPGHEWMDVINGIDWTQIRMQEAIFGRLAAAKKVPYTDRGIGIVENEVRGILNQGVSNDIYTGDPAPVVTVPLAKNVPAADKAARILRNVTFRATLAGAIHEVEVVGTVSI